MKKILKKIAELYQYHIGFNGTLVWIISGVTSALLASYDHLVLLNLIPSSVGFGEWISRSGALVTIAGIIINMEAINRHSIDSERGKNMHFDPENDPAEHSFKMWQLYSFVLIAIGTIMWAYGDLIYLYFINNPIQLW